MQVCNAYLFIPCWLTAESIHSVTYSHCNVIVCRILVTHILCAVMLMNIDVQVKRLIFCIVKSIFHPLHPSFIFLDFLVIHIFLKETGDLYVSASPGSCCRWIMQSQLTAFLLKFCARCSSHLSDVHFGSHLIWASTRVIRTVQLSVKIRIKCLKCLIISVCLCLLHKISGICACIKLTLTHCDEADTYGLRGHIRIFLKDSVSLWL